MENFNYKNCYLVGIKGVGMTSLVQILLDNQIKIMGCDVAENFVTQKILDRLQINISEGFKQQIPDEIDCLIYSAAHSGKNNPAVVAAINAGIPVYSHAEVLGYFFNLQKGVAVCGVGGKSSTSAMIVWILNFLGLNPSFSVGVGEIIGLEKTGSFNPNSQWFIAEADEFVIDPTSVDRGEPLIPRFMTMNPFITVAKELLWDHPDVYETEAKYIEAFKNFFNQIDKNGSLIYKKQKYLPGLATSAEKEIVYYPQQSKHYPWYEIIKGAGQSTQANIFIDGNKYLLQINIPGFFNIDNAMAAILCCREMGVSIADSLEALKTFKSTKRRVEKIGEKNGVLYFDDYAHHPFELENVISSFQDWFAGQRLVIAFQPHTYSRTKELFDGFVETLSKAEELILLDIFASARENPDPEISSALLRDAILAKSNAKVSLLGSIPEMAEFCKKNLKSGDVLLTIGAGDIYQVHEMI